MGEFSFNSVDFADYGVTVLEAEKDSLERAFSQGQLQERVYGWRSKLSAKRIALKVIITATPAQNIHTLLSQCRGFLNESALCDLTLSEVSGMYWQARFINMNGLLLNATNWQGDIEFILEDPRAFANAETVSNYNVDADPDTIIETTVGTERVEPVYLLTAGENLGAFTLTFSNLTTAEELVVDVTLADTDELTIDVENWIVLKNGVAAMSDVSGEFPILQPGANELKVDGFSNTGTLKITYRDAYI